MFDDRDIKIAGDKPSLSVESNGFPQTSEEFQINRANGNLQKAKQLGEDIAKALVLACKEENNLICISHSNCLSEAIKLKDAIIKESGINNILINEIGPVIGGHCGVGTIALFFIGKER